MNDRYFLYARKSTDDKERQVLSIEAQLAELKEFARRENLNIVDVLVESKTAKKPGRVVFNEMLSRIESNEADGIIAWNPDRLARNAVDGGQIINLIDTGKLRTLKFPTYWFEPSSQGLFMLSIAFGQAKYYIDNLSENVKRGLRQKLRRGEYPGGAPLGYVNDLRTHTITPHRKHAPLIKKLFELYATGIYTLKDLETASSELGIISDRTKKPLYISIIHRMLNNPFYIGLFKYKGELHEGVHAPLIDKATFDMVQQVLQEKGKPRKSKEKLQFPFRGVLTCSECGRMITAERHTKKSGLVFRYYRCTKKGTSCKPPYVHEDNLIEQVNDLIASVALPNDWATKMLRQCTVWEKEAAQSSACAASEMKTKLEKVKARLSVLLDTHLDGAIDATEYKEKKNELLEQKIDFEEKVALISSTGSSWLEPLKKWVQDAHQAQAVSFSSQEDEKAIFLKKVGSNCHLTAGRVTVTFNKPWNALSERRTTARDKNHAQYASVKDRRFPKW